MTGRKPSRVEQFKAFLAENDELGQEECASVGIRRFGLKPSQSHALIRAWLADGSLTTIATEPAGPGRPKRIVTGVQATQ